MYDEAASPELLADGSKLPGGSFRVRTQIWMIAAAFAIFGVIAWIVTGFWSPAWVGLILMGIAGFVIGLFTGK
jgi:hypothetical protein